MQSKKSKRQLKEEFDLKHKVVRKDTMLNWLKNSDLNKGAEGGDVLKAIFNNDDADSGDDDEQQHRQLGAGTNQQDPEQQQQQEEGDEDALASDEFIHKSPKHTTTTAAALLNGIDEQSSEDSQIHKLESQPTLVQKSGSSDEFDELLQDHALDMLQEECQFYKQKSEKLGKNISALEEQMRLLKQQLKSDNSEKDDGGTSEPKEEQDQSGPKEVDEASSKESDADPQMSSWRAELSNVNEEEREEELIVYKDRLAQSEIINLRLSNELADLRTKKLHAGYDNQRFLRHVLPLGCVALAAIIYFLTSRF